MSATAVASGFVSLSVATCESPFGQTNCRIGSQKGAVANPLEADSVVNKTIPIGNPVWIDWIDRQRFPFHIVVDGLGQVMGHLILRGVLLPKKGQDFH